MKKLETLCVHPLSGQDNIGGGVTSAILPSAAYHYLDTEERRYPGFYSTYNQEKLAAIIAGLEHGEWGLIFTSGMAAITTAILSFAQQNDHIIFSRDLYGGTWKLAEDELPKRGISFSYADNTLTSFQDALQANTKVIYIETPSNPLLKVVPLKEIADFAKKNGIITIVDNTFASPVNQLPLDHGIDISVHSGTKYLGGHNDLPYGALVSKLKIQKDPIYFTANMYGGSLSPYQCYLAERSLKTLALRVKRQNENAMRIAQYLEKHPAVERVYYPGLQSHDDYQIAVAQMQGFGGMLSFELRADAKELIKFQRSLTVIEPAISLGGVESLICSPAQTSHRYISSEARHQLGINENLLRLSVGIEDVEDLIDDIESAIDKSK
ncbi:cystathionine beta-lyase [Mucilaginibacter pineti]|uniref:cysteine-S-conjugate beta-lyase n=1 Tax=Mucilaginibacter pineti TaxID=1391627 RepID=A0A1G7NU94_9SPHI|nr:PLP-dependent aspartate aminotransferase family protein [Mucilaginibacter pineti]SDF76889.1 cystathionine beta-lyase [Mucilaginibacter pineti]